MSRFSRVTLFFMAVVIGLVLPPSTVFQPYAGTAEAKSAKAESSKEPSGRAAGRDKAASGARKGADRDGRKSGREGRAGQKAEPSATSGAEKAVKADRKAGTAREKAAQDRKSRRAEAKAKAKKATAGGRNGASRPRAAPVRVTSIAGPGAGPGGYAPTGTVRAFPVAVDGPIPDVEVVPDTAGNVPEPPAGEDKPDPAPVEPRAVAAGSDPSGGGPATTPSTPDPDRPGIMIPVTPNPLDEAPATPVKVDGPLPDPRPTVVPAPDPKPAAKPVPVKVDGPRPDAPGATPVARPTADTPPAKRDEAAGDPRDDRPRKKPTKRDGVAHDERKDGPELIRGLLDQGKTAMSPNVVIVKRAKPAAKAGAAVEEGAAGPKAKATAEPATRATKAAREPAAARGAPRIALSSGESADVYRRREISALGLTPAARQTMTALGFKIISERRSALLGNRVLTKLRTPANQTAEAALKRVGALLPEVTFEFAHLYKPSGEQPVPVRYPAEMIGARADSSCMVDTRIGLIDTGVGQHEALAGASITRRAFVERDAATNVAHGTAIASILVGDLPGTSPLAAGAQLYSANVFVQNGSALRADAHAIIEALDWMSTQGVRVVNLSLIGPPNFLLEQAVRAAAERGLVLVAAAGNQGPNSEPAYPAAYAGVIAVAAVDQRGRPYGRGNRGSYIYVAAPGVDVWGADARGGEAFWTGTSFAAPFVTAAVARDLSLGRAHDINDGRARIAAGARDLGAPGRDPIYGYGLLQVDGCGAGPTVLSTRN